MNRIMVTGGESMIGHFVCKKLLEMELKVDSVPHNECDIERIDELYERMIDFCPDSIIHLAGYNGGIEWNRKYPAEIFIRNAQIATNILRACYMYCDLEKLVCVLPSCAYPDLQDEYMKEKDFWSGLPNSSVECHGLAKRMLHAGCRQLKKERNLDSVCVVLNNCYGPKDSYNPYKTKAVGALIKKIVDAHRGQSPSVECWGTGTPKREFLYAEDAAEAIIRCWESYDDVDEPVNVSTGVETSIKELAELIAKIVKYEGDILWDSSKPDGQMKKSLDITKMKEILKYEPVTTLEDGLGKTIQWYVENIAKV